MSNDLEEVFPRLKECFYKETSPEDTKYNCIAFAAGDKKHWWWPVRSFGKNGYWPATAPKEETVDAFEKAFQSLGYAKCGNHDLEEGFEKIAVYANENGPQHASIQKENGLWASKLGDFEDIEHEFEGVSGREYGFPVLIMKRPKE